MADRLEMARESIAALNRRDVEAVVEAFASDAEWWPLRSSTEGPYRGHDGVRAWFADTAEMFEHLRAEVEEVHERGDVVVAFGRLEAKGRESGASVELVISWVFRFADDKVIWAKSFADRDEAIAECGFEPPGVPRPSGNDPEQTR
jgi:ketosteroid isomerase-like protein